MGLDLYIARRYLVAKKSLGVIHVISMISAIGMAIGTAALILILSIYNGFDRVIRDNLSDLSPDVLVTPAHGKYFVPEGPAFDALLDDPRITQVSSVLEEEVFLSYDGRQELARAKGVDAVYEEETRLAEHVVEGTFALHTGDVPQAAVGVGLAFKMGIRPRFTEPLTFYFPRRGARIPLAGPASALSSIKLHPGCLLSISADVDEQMVLLPIGQMRTLLGLQEEVSGIELRLDRPADKRLLRELQELLGPEFLVRDRIQQQPALYKMMRYEKLAIYLILIFVVVIIAFNIYSALKMLVIEKQGDMATLRSLGAPEPLLRKVFLWEGVLVSALGVAIGVAIGVLLVWLQDRFGLVPMPGNFLVSSYPVALKATDILWTLLGVGGVAFLMAYFPSRKV